MSKIGSLAFRIIDRFSLTRRFFIWLGLRFKWGLIMFIVVVTIVSSISAVYIFLSTRALMDANDKLCRTIAGNISSAESFLSVERKPLKRSLILQDIVYRLSHSEIDGLVNIAVYDLRGILAEKKLTFAAHSVSRLRGTAIPDADAKSVAEITDTEREMVRRDVDGTMMPCYRYRFPFKFFGAMVGVTELVFTEESVLGPVKRAKLYILLVGIFMLVFGITIARVFAKAMLRPIAALTQDVKLVGQGDLDVRIEVSTHDEIGVLSGEFNVMIDHLREKLQMQKFVSQSTIDMIKEKTREGDIGLGGTRENLAFLFSDVRGFTAMSEMLNPEEVVSIINAYLDLQAQVIQKYEGDIDKFVGDEVMAEFKGPKRADNALRASVEIIAAIRKLNRERGAQGLRTVEVGIGLNIGEVVHGRMGSRDRMDNTSIGDTVNLAARLCSKADAGTILASKAIMSAATKGRFMGKRLESITVKGKTAPVDIFQVTGAK